MRRALGLLSLLALAGCGARSDIESPDAPGSAGACVLFGGFPYAQGAAVGDTWVFDAGKWTASAASLDGIGPGAMATLGGQVVLFAAVSSNIATSTQTWTWSGGAWIAQAPPAPPPALVSPGVAAAGGGVVLFGGATITDGPDYQAGTWLWNGSAFTEAHPAHAPSARWRASMAAIGGEVVLFGGQGAAGVMGDTWTWDGADWTELHPAGAPSARSGAAVAAVGERILLFGGYVGGGFGGTADEVADTWSWDGSGWTQLSPSASPPARDCAALATTGTSTVLFGGFAAGDASTLGDTWLWDGATWKPGPTAGPSPRGLAAMGCW